MGEQLKAYQPADLWDEEILFAFQEQFEGWTEDMFKKVHHTYLREMKKLLHTRGINTGPTNRGVAAQLAALLDRKPEVPPECNDGDDFFEPGTNDHWSTTAPYLADQTSLYALSGNDIQNAGTLTESSEESIPEDRYSRKSYQGIMPKTGAANLSTVGKEQLMALQREDSGVTFDATTAGRHSVALEDGTITTNVGTATVHTAIGIIKFEVVDELTPFILCLKDMDDLCVFFNNIRNELVQETERGNVRYPVTRKWGHPWFHL